jgi:hypothetical protein
MLDGIAHGVGFVIGCGLALTALGGALLLLARDR